MSSARIRPVASAAALVASGLVAGGVLAGSLSAHAATPSPSPSQDGGTTSTAPRAPHQHTAATAAETQKVKDAVKAAYAGSTVTTVQKDPDGSFDAIGSDASGNPIAYDVSADLKTVTPHAGRGPGGPGGHGRGGPGRHAHTAVTGTEAQKVKDAVKDEDAGTTITVVQKDPDGSYDALGTDASGNPIAYDVSADLKTVTVRPAPGPDGRGPGGPGAPPAGTTPSSTTPSSTTSAT